ncbi:MAG TPA: hypothetical protein VFM56_10970, partial [Solimonas sp.]|nr:hypothetical protein [Solimonas sp.]
MSLQKLAASLAVAVTLVLAACGTSSASGDGMDQAAGEAGGDTPVAGNAPACGWVLQSDADIINVAYPDESATYWVAVIPNIPG